MAEGPGAGEGRLEILAHLTRLRLACCNPRLVQDTGAPASSKLATFAETLEELLANRHKVLVFSQFVKHLKLIEEYLAGAGIAWQYLDGSTPARARAERIAAFQAGRGDVFLISLRAGGVGLNLTAADYVVHMDPWWNPGRGGSGIGPRAPHRADAPGDHLPAGGEGNHRGADRRAAPPQARPRRAASGRRGRTGPAGCRRAAGAAAPAHCLKRGCASDRQGMWCRSWERGHLARNGPEARDCSSEQCRPCYLPQA